MKTRTYRTSKFLGTIKQLAPLEYNATQIADEVGTTTQNVKQVANKNGIKITKKVKKGSLKKLGLYV